MHPEIFSACTKQRFAYTSRSRAADDKEKCCLESRSCLNLGHPDDGACTFSTILLFLLSVLPRVRSPPFDRTTPFLFGLLSPSFPLVLYLLLSFSCLLALASIRLTPPSSFYLSAFLLNLSPPYVSSPFPSIASFSLPAPFFPTRRDSRIEFRRTTRCGIGEKKGGT